MSDDGWNFECLKCGEPMTQLDHMGFWEVILEHITCAKCGQEHDVEWEDSEGGQSGPWLELVG